MFFSFAKITEAQCFLFFWYFSFSIFISFRNTLCRIWTFFCNFGSMLFSFSLFFFLYFLLTWFWLHGNSMLSFFIFAGHEQSILDMFVTRFLFILPFLLLSAGTHFFPSSVLFLIKKTRTFLEEHTFMCQKVSSFKLKQLKATRAKRISYKYNGNGNCAQEIHTKGKIIHRFFEKYGKKEETSRSLDKRKKFQWMKEREREWMKTIRTSHTFEYIPIENTFKIVCSFNLHDFHSFPLNTLFDTLGSLALFSG